MTQDPPHPKPVALRQEATPRRRRRKKKRRFSVPAALVFYVTAALGTVGSAIVYLRGSRFLFVAAGAFVLMLAVLIINERGGFTRSKHARRSGERRVTFTQIEIIILFGLVMLCAFVSVRAIL